MIAFSVTDIKSFMNKLLKEDTFDLFEIRGIEITAFTKFEISGKLENTTNYCTWQRIRPYVFNIIKGGTKPKSIKIIFSLDGKEALKLHNNAAAVYLNMYFEGDMINFTTAVSQKSFSFDKTLNHVWEDYIKDFFKKNGLLITHSL